MSRHHLVSGLMAFCAVLVAAWLLLAHFNPRAERPYGLRYDDFAEFVPAVTGWDIQKQPRASQIETDANIVAFSLARVPAAELSVISHRLSVAGDSTDHRSPLTDHPPSSSSTDHGLVRHSSPSDGGSLITDHRFYVRLVHGYSMPMCMKRKSYVVEKIQDHKVTAVTDPRLRSAFTVLNPESRIQNPESGNNSTIQQLATASSLPSTINHQPSTIPPSYPLPVQLWRLTSAGGEVSYWATTMIREGDFKATREDICSMPYPRVDFPDDPNWTPRGFSRKWLKNPREEFRIWFHSKWDGANWDVLAFLRLRPTASPSEELLSYMTLVHVSGKAGQAQAVADVLAVHQAMLGQLQAWRAGRR